MVSRKKIARDFFNQRLASSFSIAMKLLKYIPDTMAIDEYT